MNREDAFNQEIDEYRFGRIDPSRIYENPDIIHSQLTPFQELQNDVYVPRTNFSLNAEKIIISTTVKDEFGNALNGANIWIDGIGKGISSNGGNVFIKNVATETSMVRISYVGYNDFNISAIFLPKIVRLERSITVLNEVVVLQPKKPILDNSTILEVLPMTNPIAEATLQTGTSRKSASINWLLLLVIGGLGYKAYNSAQDNKTVKAKI